MGQIDEIVKEFLVESYENLDQLDGDLLALEEVPDDRDRLSSIFRTIHTIKGTSGFLGFQKLEHVTHTGENLLVPLRDGAIRLTNEIADGLLAMVDAVREILSQIESEGSEGEGDYEGLVEILDQLRASKIGGAAAVARTTPLPVTAPQTDAVVAAEADHAVPQEAELDLDESQQPVTSESEHDELNASDEITSSAAEASPHPESRRRSPAAKAPKNETQGDSNHGLSETTVRLDVSLLDRLMNLVGELVLARNQIVQFSHENEDAAMTAASQRLNLITTELQEGVMKTRMQPIRNVWSKLPPRGPRPVTRVWQASAGQNGRCRHRTRQNDSRSDQGPTHSHRAKLGRPRH